METRSVNVRTGKSKAFRGISFEDLKKLELREFAQHLTSRERRSLLRNTQKMEKFLEKSRKDNAKNKMPKTHSRELIIIPEMLGWTIGIYNGKEYVQVKIVEDMLGHRFGEFALTRRVVKHSAAGVGATRGSASKSVK